MKNRINYVLLSVLCLTVFAVSFGVTYKKVSAQAVFLMPNELVDAAQVTNKNLAGTVTGHKGYVVVGTGAFNSGKTGMTIKSPVPNVKILFEDGNHCGTNKSVGSWTGVDSPPPDPASTTTFVVVEHPTQVIFGPAANQPAILTGQQDCVNHDITTRLLDLEPFPDGSYGGLIGVKFNAVNGGSQQNSFRAIVLDSAGNQLKSAEIGFKPNIVNSMINVLQAVDPSVSSNTLAMSITNTDLPRYGLTDFGLPFSVPCDSASNNFYVPLTFYDIDHALYQGVWANATTYIPDISVQLESSPRGANSWSSVRSWILDTLPSDGNRADGTSGDSRNGQSVTISNFGPFIRDMDYRIRVNDIVRVNAIQFSVNSQDLQSTNIPGLCTPPTCTVTIDNVLPIAPGDRITFTAHVQNAGKYALGLNGSSFSKVQGDGTKNNYLLTSGIYNSWTAIRGSPTGVGNGGDDLMIMGTDAPIDKQIDDITVTDYSAGPPGPTNISNMFAPATPGTYAFDWGLVEPNIGWSGVTCTGPSFTVVAPDQNPVITITETCNNAAGIYTITIDTTDPDPGTSTVSYSGFANGSQASNSIVLARDPTASVTISASTNGVRPVPTLVPKSASAGPTTFGPCIYSFSLGASSGLPVLDDTEQPTTVNSVAFTTTYASTSPVGVKGISSNKQMYAQKAGVYQPPYLIGPEITNVDFTVGVNDIRSNISLAGRNLVAGDSVCSLYNIGHTAGYVDRAGNPISNASYPLAGASANTAQCTIIVNRPYLRTYGADVMAGSGFGQNCTSADAEVKGFTRSVTSPLAGYVGAGNQFGVFASGTVTNFLSMTLADAINAGPTPNARTFSNQVAGSYGGNFGVKSCSYDFWSNRGSLTAGGNSALNSLPSGRYSRDPGSLNIGAVGISNRIAIFVDGDITINKNITYASTSWDSEAAIPSIYIIARGNIYIDPRVTQLEGYYIAQPITGSETTTGRIFTCTDNGSSPTNAAILGGCNSTLRVNGAFVAQHVNFMRSHGTLRAAAAAVPVVVPTCTAANPVIVYQDYKFLTNNLAPLSLAAGTYDSSNMPAGSLATSRQISSVKVPPGCRVILRDNTTGASKELLTDWTVVNAGSNFNDSTTSVEVYSYPVSQKQLGFLWSTTGRIENPATYDCIEFFEPSDPFWPTGTATSKDLCVRKGTISGFSWSATGPIAGKTCVSVAVTDPNGWNDNYVCSSADLGLKWNIGAALPDITGMYCIVLSPGAGDTHMAQINWDDNVLCEPTALAPAVASSLPAETATTSGATNIAEQFSISPDMFFAAPSTTPTDTTGTFESIVSLPPSL